MFLIMMLSVLQICFIPGFIVYIFLNWHSDDSKVLLLPVFSFALSLIINYIIVSSLACFHVYTRTSLIILVLIEFIILTVIFVSRTINVRGYNLKMNLAEAGNDINLLYARRKSGYGFIQFAFFIFSAFLLMFLLAVFINNAGNIFSAWDAVVSWNRWAIDFYNNKFPSGIWHYPQLIPANWSIAYVLSGFPLQFIPRGMMPLFMIFMVYSFIILGIKKRSVIFFLSSIFLYQTLMRLNWTDGYVDVPVAFFSILVYICLSLAEEAGSKNDKQKYIISGALFACGAAVTKQAGIFMVILYPVLLFFLTKNNFRWTSRRIAKFSCIYLCMIVFIILPFYLYAEMAIKSGLESSEIGFLTNGIYDGATYAERLIGACRLFTTAFSSKLLFLVGIILFVFSLSDKTFRILNITVVIPYFLIWAIFFSYDLRNLTIMLPYFCLGIGSGFEIILHKVKITSTK
jgi:hypothetical protein